MSFSSAAPSPPLLSRPLLLLPTTRPTTRRAGREHGALAVVTAPPLWSAHTPWVALRGAPTACNPRRRGPLQPPRALPPRRTTPSGKRARKSGAAATAADAPAPPVPGLGDAWNAPRPEGRLSKTPPRRISGPAESATTVADLRRRDTPRLPLSPRPPLREPLVGCGGAGRCPLCRPHHRREIRGGAPPLARRGRRHDQPTLRSPTVSGAVRTWYPSRGRSFSSRSGCTPCFAGSTGSKGFSRHRLASGGRSNRSSCGARRFCPERVKHGKKQGERGGCGRRRGGGG